MSKTAEKTDESLWAKVKTAVTKSDKGGRPRQWSARKAQIAVHDYKAEGGGYSGAKSADNHLTQWTDEKWATKSGAPSGETGERYLPKKAREHLSDAEYERSSAKKRADTARGKQFSPQPKDIARKTARDRMQAEHVTRADLLHQAATKGIVGRSRMRKAELQSALQAKR